MYSLPGLLLYSITQQPCYHMFAPWRYSPELPFPHRNARHTRPLNSYNRYWSLPAGQTALLQNSWNFTLLANNDGLVHGKSLGCMGQNRGFWGGWRGDQGFFYIESTGITIRLHVFAYPCSPARWMQACCSWELCTCSFGRADRRDAVAFLTYQKRQTDTFRVCCFFASSTLQCYLKGNYREKGLVYSVRYLTDGWQSSLSFSILSCPPLSLFFKESLCCRRCGDVMIERKGKGNNYIGNSTRCGKKKVNELTPCSNPIRTFRGLRGIKCGNK